MSDAIETFKKLEAELLDSYRYIAESCANDISFNIVGCMEKAGVTSKQLSKKTGISKMRMTQLLNGISNVTINTLAKIAYALDCSIYDLVKKV